MAARRPVGPLVAVETFMGILPCGVLRRDRLLLCLGLDPQSSFGDILNNHHEGGP
jgi:hypothetical protein